MSSPLAEVIEEAPPSDRRLRANWRAREWRAKQRARREREWLEALAAAGVIDWGSLRVLPIAEPQPVHVRECQWIDRCGCFCGEPVIRRGVMRPVCGGILGR